MKNNLLYLLLCLSLAAFSQERKTLNGRVVTDGAGIGGIFIINKNTGAEKKSDAMGNFTVEARAGDVIAAYSARTEVRDFIISEESFLENPFMISINAQAYELDEVVVEKRVTSESLGLVPPGQKQYTPAERKLFTATSGFGIDIILNALSGRTKMLKRAVETEKKEMLMELIGNVCTEEEIRTEYKIPDEYIRGFVYYAVEDKEFASALKAGNDTMTRFLLTGLAAKYREIIANEK
ncbi:hypothetical protein [uncultured Flavobacterium sp.]|uniref:hypothetical protein n=1 Tax=uncultured Flavobacterium sp. TaxID=165435 RepID=UPI0025E7DF20|nr:hypothetical protein [uncultured Flavobacterium sp.]